MSAKELLFFYKLIIIIVTLASEQAARQQAESNAAAVAAAHNNNAPLYSQLIPKPRGSAGDGYRLIEEMGLENEKLSYNAVVVSPYLFIILYSFYSFHIFQATVHELCYGAGLDWQCPYSRQSKEKLVRIFEVVSLFFSYEAVRLMSVRLANGILTSRSSKITGLPTQFATNTSKITDVIF